MTLGCTHLKYFDSRSSFYIPSSVLEMTVVIIELQTICHTAFQGLLACNHRFGFLNIADIMKHKKLWRDD
jgi:hypothetical protein